MSSSPARVVLTVLTDALIVVAVLLTAAILVAFFGELYDTGVGQGVVRIASYVTLPLGIGSVGTPFGGIFLYDAAVTLALALVAEWAVSGTRERT